jgi:phytoene dehydrogenase-like protein
VQPSLFDSTRAPAGKHTVWAYCHVPNGHVPNGHVPNGHAANFSMADMPGAIESQIERFAPGFRERILARHLMPPAEVERHNANLIGGDIAGGANDLGQMFLRPTPRLYNTPLPGVFLCSSSTPPGGGVHGMCGYYAARAALRGAVVRDRGQA